MADPTKEPIEPKKDELTADELDTVTGGAIDAFLDFTTRDTTPPPSEKPDVRKAGGEHVEFLRYNLK